MNGHGSSLPLLFLVASPSEVERQHRRAHSAGMAGFLLTPEDTRRLSRRIFRAPTTGQVRCCCCCRLRDGVVAIGCVYAVLGLLALVTSFIFLLTLNCVEPDGCQAWDVFCYTAGVVALIQLLVSVSLTYGGLKGKPVFLLPWTVYALVCVTTSLAAIIYFFVRLLQGNVVALAWLIAGVAQAALHLYFVVVITIYHDHLRKQDEGEHLLDPADSSSLV